MIDLEIDSTDLPRLTMGAGGVVRLHVVEQDGRRSGGFELRDGSGRIHFLPR